MNKKSLFQLTTLSAVLLVSSSSWAALEGYATRNGGTTGGKSGNVVYAKTGTEINEAMCNRTADDTPLIIYITGTINHANTTKAKGSCDTTASEIQFKGVKNISLIGKGTALLDEIGIHIRDSSNIIIRNIHVRNVKKSAVLFRMVVMLSVLKRMFTIFGLTTMNWKHPVAKKMAMIR